MTKLVVNTQTIETMLEIRRVLRESFIRLDPSRTITIWIMNVPWIVIVTLSCTNMTNLLIGFLRNHYFSGRVVTVSLKVILTPIFIQLANCNFKFPTILLIVVGQIGLGKSTLINTIFASHLIDSKGRLDTDEIICQTTEIQVAGHVVVENNVKLRLNIVDTPGYGDMVNNDGCWEPIINEVVNVVPVIAKSDGLTLEEREAFKVRIQGKLHYHSIMLYPFDKEDHDSEEIQLNEAIRYFFGFGQAVACTEAGHKAMKPNGKFDGPNDPRVQSVQKIYRYYKQEGYKTIVMGASFQNTGEIKKLARCDFLTISPALLDELHKSDQKVEQKLSVQKAQTGKKLPKVSYVDNEPELRWALLQDEMAWDKLHESIKKFAEDSETLKSLLQTKLQ
ncbi:hypothetical protein PPACK8108_LOCUS5189 [Phakopsora pachyrhizi]|uniref:Septin-type G domain-containing protein n=1 Tax=Phakopsora pachyrhizi TaxID=170000 RepID=A0AAV0AR61_PHAPC|nr:hypothetical protein PPACK8108_LOCUS5189 [Phakopsora pachyrhizi]